MKTDILKKVVSADAIEEGNWLQFIDPKTDEPLYLDPATKTKPFRAKVRSTRSKRYRDMIESLQNRAMRRANRGKPKEQDEMFEALQKTEKPKKLAALLVGLENASDEPGVPSFQHNTDEDSQRLCDDGDAQWMIEQIFDHASSDKNYGVEQEGEPRKNSQAADSALSGGSEAGA